MKSCLTTPLYLNISVIQTTLGPSQFCSILLWTLLPCWEYCYVANLRLRPLVLLMLYYSQCCSIWYAQSYAVWNTILINNTTICNITNAKVHSIAINVSFSFYFHNLYHFFHSASLYASSSESWYSSFASLSSSSGTSSSETSWDHMSPHSECSSNIAFCSILEYKRRSIFYNNWEESGTRILDHK